MDDNDQLPVRLKHLPIPRREERDDGSTVMTWRLGMAHPCEVHLLMRVAAELTNDSILLQVEEVENDDLVVSVRSKREISYTAVWDFSGDG